MFCGAGDFSKPQSAEQWSMPACARSLSRTVHTLRFHCKIHAESEEIEHTLAVWQRHDSFENEYMQFIDCVQSMLSALRTHDNEIIHLSLNNR